MGKASAIETATRLAAQAQREGLTPHHLKAFMISGAKADHEGWSGFSNGWVGGHSRSQNIRIYRLRRGINQLPENRVISVRTSPDLLCATCPIRTGGKYFKAEHLEQGQKPCDPEGELIARENLRALTFIDSMTGRTDLVEVSMLKRVPLKRKPEPRRR